MKKTPTRTITVLAILLIALSTAFPAYAASSGRISGGSFRSSPSGGYSRSGGFSSSPRTFSGGGSLSIPRTSAPSSYSGSYSGRYRNGGSNTSIIFLPSLSPSVNNPVSQPLVSSNEVVKTEPVNPAALLFLLGITGVAVLAAFLLSGGWDDFVAPWLGNYRRKFQKFSIIRTQVALLASAKDVQGDLIRLAKGGNTRSSYGLSKLLESTALSLLRNKDKTVYAWSSVEQVPSEKAEERFSQLALEERSKSTEEVLSNVGGEFSVKTFGDVADSEGNEYILVSLLIASEKKISLKPSDSAENLQENLVSLASIDYNNLLALEILWQPEGRGEVLTQEDLLTLYPSLNCL